MTRTARRRPLAAPAVPTVPAALAAVLASAVLAACGGGSTTSSAAPAPSASAPAGASASAAAQASFPLTFTSCGREVTLTGRPERVLTVGTSAPAILTAAGAADTVVARAGEFGTGLAGPVAAQVADARVLTDGDPSLEAIIGSGADTVVGYGLFETTPEDVEKAGITPVTLTGECGHDQRGALSDATTFEAVFRDVEFFGEVFGTGATAAEAVAGLRARVEAVTAAAQDAPEQSAALAYFWGDQLSIAGGRSVAHDQFAALGLTNAFADVDNSFAEIGPEVLVGKDPDVIVLGVPEGETFEAVKATLVKQAGVADLAAVQAGRVYPLDTALYAPDPSMVDGLETMADLLGRR